MDKLEEGTMDKLVAFYRLGHSNRLVAYAAVYRFAGFSQKTSEVLGRIDCDRSYNPRHVPCLVTSIAVVPKVTAPNLAGNGWCFGLVTEVAVLWDGNWQPVAQYE